MFEAECLRFSTGATCEYLRFLGGFMSLERKIEIRYQQICDESRKQRDREDIPCHTQLDVAGTFYPSKWMDMAARMLLQ